MSHIKPIETRYNGRLFRSRLEARWAVFFTKAWLRWDYEVEGFILPSGPYLPDFLLHTDDGGYWVEIKPRGEPTERDFRRVWELSAETGKEAFLVAGNPFPGEYACWQLSGKCDQIIHHYTEGETSGAFPLVWMAATDVPWDPDAVTITNAFNAATAERFEPRRRGHSFTPASDVLEQLRAGPRIGRALDEAEARKAARPRPEGELPA